jgi:hypothetical protein
MSRYDPIVRNDFMNTLVSPIYGTTGYVTVDTIHSHKLSVFFITMACGVLYDSHPSASTLAQQYHALSRAALSVDSIVHEANCATVQALFMIIRFIYISDPRGEERWLLGGLCVKVAQVVCRQQHLLNLPLTFLNIVLRLDFVGTNPGVAFQILLT